MLKTILENASIILQVVGGVEMILGWATHRWPSLPRRIGDFMMVMGVILLAAGIFVGLEERADWKLDDEQREGLKTALKKQSKPFEVWFYPLGRGTGAGPDLYATEIFRIFLTPNWPVKMPSTNWVSPNTTGVSIATCPGIQRTSMRVLTLQKILDEAGIKYGHTTEEGLIKRGCETGFIIGLYPPFSERVETWLAETF